LGLRALTRGARFAWIDAHATLDEIVALLEREKATQLHCGIALLRLLVQHPRARQAFGSLVGIRTIGDIVEWRDLHALFKQFPGDAVIYCGYGSTEAPQSAGWFATRDLLEDDGRIPPGYPTPGSELWIDRSAAGQGDDGIVGELVAGGERLSAGYWNDPRATAAAFATHPDDTSQRIYRTGDLVRLAPDGLVFFLGRVDNQVKLHGWRIELEEIEAAARDTPHVVQAGVAPRRDDSGKVEALVLYVAGARDAEAPDKTRVARHLGQVLPSYMRPAHIHVVETLAQTASGKVDRPRLQEIDAQRRDRETKTPVSGVWDDPLAARIAAIISREARVRDFSRENTFTDLGGDSLEALQTALSIEKTFGVALDPTVLLEDRCLGEIVDDLTASVRDVVAEDTYSS
jgi:acyl-coenzyme A synthetase/AMP-(fatty) acid ligase/acyl carrier protein